MAHTIKALLSHYDAAFMTKFGTHLIFGAKDAALAKRLLARYTSEQLEGWIERLFASDDPFILQSGYSFGVFYSQIGKLIVEESRQRVQRPTITEAAQRAADRREQSNRETTQLVAEEYYRTHPWVKRPSIEDVQ